MIRLHRNRRTLASMPMICVCRFKWIPILNVFTAPVRCPIRIVNSFEKKKLPRKRTKKFEMQFFPLHWRVYHVSIGGKVLIRRHTVPVLSVHCILHRVNSGREWRRCVECAISINRLQYYKWLLIMLMSVVHVGVDARRRLRRRHPVHGFHLNRPAQAGSM